MEVRGRLELAGDNRSSNLYPIKLPSWNDPYEFKILPKARQEIIGHENLMGVNQSTFNPEQVFASKDHVPEPCFFFENPMSLGLELIHGYDWQRIVHFTASNGWLALAGLAARVPGVYFCLTEAHKQALKRHLTQCVFMMKQDAKQKQLYDPHLVTLLEKVKEQMVKVATPKKDPDSSTSTTTPAKEKKEVKVQGKKKAKAEEPEEPGEPPKKKAKKDKPPKKKGKKKADATSEESSEWTSSDPGEDD